MPGRGDGDLNTVVQSNACYAPLIPPSILPKRKGGIVWLPHISSKISSSFVLPSFKPAVGFGAVNRSVLKAIRPFLARKQRCLYALPCKRHLAQAYACGIKDGIRDGGRRGDGRRLARPQRRLVRASISGTSENVRIGNEQ